MATNNKDDTLDRLRKLLNRDKIRLWEPPFTTPDDTTGQYSEDFLQRYTTEAALDGDVLRSLCETLRLHALDKLAARRRYQDTGVTSLKVKVAGDVPQSYKETNPSLTLTLEVNLREDKGRDLKVKISEVMAVDSLRLKLIAQGRVIEDEANLETQGVKMLTAMMCLVLSQTEADARLRDEQMAKVSRTRQAAEFLSNHTHDDYERSGEYYLQIADQTGKVLDLPDEERKALTLAMTLHEKGRAAMKRHLYTDALLLLLEADAEFMKCRASILEAVDNYGLVCLDVVWCYLCLRNLHGLHDAEKRLQACDACFKRSYGANLERLALVKGGTGEEEALLLRLHLLQGILAYHQQDYGHARTLLTQAQAELSTLKVDEDKMTQVMTLGFSAAEARLGLRGCGGHVEAAVAHIIKKKQEKKELKKKEKEEKKRKSIAKELGKTANGEDVNVTHYTNLQAMGFCKGAAAEVLRQTNNDILAALQVLQDNPALLNLPDPEDKKVKVTDDMVSQVTAMGFEAIQARAVLHRFHGDVARSIDELLRVGGIVPPAWISEIPAASTSAGTSGDEEGGNDGGRSSEDKALAEAAISDIVPDIPTTEDDHLDLGLTEEQGVLDEYLGLVMSRGA